MDNKLRILINQLVKEEVSLFEKKLKKDQEEPEEELNLDDSSLIVPFSAAYKARM